MTFLSHYQCPSCGAEFTKNELHSLCECGSPILARYELDKAQRSMRKEELGMGPNSLWRYSGLLPVERPETAVTFGEGMTPIVDCTQLAESLDIRRLWVKSEGSNPGGTFKARGASVGVTRARELGVTTVALASSGSAATAWAVYGRRAGLEVVAVLQPDTPVDYELECRLAGARVKRAPREIRRGARSIVENGVRESGWFDVTAMAEPHRVEGKKTLAFEIAEQMQWELPDFIIQPTGGGVGIIGMAKGFEELRAIGWIDSPTPRLVAAQSATVAPVVEALRADLDPVIRQGAHATTMARNLAVREPIALDLVVEAIRASNGDAFAVEDWEILHWISEAAESEGLIMGPEGAAALAAASGLVSTGRIDRDSTVLVIDTSSPARQIDALEGALAMRNRRQVSHRNSAENADLCTEHETFWASDEPLALRLASGWST